MNATEHQETALERVLIELAHSRGLDCLDELRNQLIAAGHHRTAKHLEGILPLDSAVILPTFST
jgi:hypothetical protein